MHHLTRQKERTAEGQLLRFSPTRYEVIMESYQQLAYEQRCQISVLTKRGCPQRDITESVGVRELARNTGERVVIGEREKISKLEKMATPSR